MQSRLSQREEELMKLETKLSMFEDSNKQLSVSLMSQQADTASLHKVLHNVRNKYLILVLQKIRQKHQTIDYFISRPRLEAAVSRHFLSFTAISNCFLPLSVIFFIVINEKIKMDSTMDSSRNFNYFHLYSNS